MTTLDRLRHWNQAGVIDDRPARDARGARAQRAVLGLPRAERASLHRRPVVRRRSGVDVPCVLHQPWRPLHPGRVLAVVCGLSLLLFFACGTVLARRGRIPDAGVRLRVVPRMSGPLGRARVHRVPVRPVSRGLGRLPADDRRGVRAPRLSIRQSLRPVPGAGVAGGMVRVESVGVWLQVARVAADERAGVRRARRGSGNGPVQAAAQAAFPGRLSSHCRQRGLRGHRVWDSAIDPRVRSTLAR